MEFNLLTVNEIKISEVVSDETIIHNTQDMLDLLVNAGARNILLCKHHFCGEFYNLRTGLLGEILQKCVNYRIRLAIIGDFSEIQSKSFRDFIHESNSNGDFLFTVSKEEAVARLGSGR